ncbi:MULTISPECIES: hypothetical protein [Streptomyces]|uniref:Uncharacterized protein n=1 Tax=Streptomyces yunnanensis TaxID=156453 RepID=A0A9X8QXX6_9ACTN|nr:hypothetical protein SAMN05216268_116105 [Streptomyces yunnanensis]
MLTLSVLCELVAFLSIGLVRRWGEVISGWIPLTAAVAISSYRRHRAAQRRASTA